MQRLVTILVAVLFAYIANGQSFTVFDIDNSNYPTMRAKFYAFDENYNHVTDLSISDFEMFANGDECQITNVSCPPPKEPEAISSVLVIDVSGSMAGNNLNIAKEAAKSWINALPLGKSECAITAFDHYNYLIQDFSQNRTSLLERTETLSAIGGTDYDAALINPMAGGLLISKNGQHKKTIIFLTDGVGSLTKQSEIIQEANNQNTSIYVVTIGMRCPEILKTIAGKTGAVWFENVSTVEEIKKIYLRILQFEQTSNPCDIEWNANIACQSNIFNEISCLPISATDNFSYNISNNHLAILDFSPAYLDFGEVLPGEKKDMTLTVTAENSDYTVNNITITDPAFSVSPNSFSLAEGESRNLTVTFAPIDESYSYCSFEFEADPCNNRYMAVGGFIHNPLKQKTLELLHPNGGEEFVIGSDTNITWRGILGSDSVTLSISRDNGSSWEILSDTSSNLSENWFNISPPASNECLMKIKQNVGIAPSELQWQKCLGGSDRDEANSIIQTTDGGYAIAGFTNSNDGDVSGNHGKTDAWIVKLSEVGELEWQRCFGETSLDKARSIIQTADDGYVIAGHTYIVDPDPNSLKGYDALVVKLSSSGDVQWQKHIGESRVDYPESIIQTTDGGYAITGRTESNDSDAVFWILKLSSSGDVQWQKSFGGSAWDEARSIIQTTDGGYAIAGRTESSDGDVSGNHGGYDAWIVKLSEVGELEWQRCIGGRYLDYAESIIQTTDGGYTIAGFTMSNDGDVIGNHGNSDAWIVKLSAAGKLEWQRCLGGTMEDKAYSIIQTADGNYAITGLTNSSDGDVSYNNGGVYDAWVVKLSLIGDIQWEKCFGGNKSDIAYSIIQTADLGYSIAGTTRSSDGDVSGRHGDIDAWVVKLSADGLPAQEDISDATFSIVQAEVTSDNIDMGDVLIGTDKDRTITDFIVNITKYPCRIKSIKFEGADASYFSLVAGLPEYTIEGNSSHFAEIRFSPTEVRNYNADIVIITQSDTLNYTITGRGYEHVISVTNNWIDFGQVNLGQAKDSIAVTIKNISNTDLEILDTKHAFPNDVDFTTKANGGNFILSPNEEHTMTLCFTPSELGRTSGTLEFHYNGIGSPAVVQLFGEGVNKKPSISNTIESFENLLCDYSSDVTVSLTNDGDEDLIIDNMSISGDDTDDFSISETTPITVEPHNTKEITVTFSPKSIGDKTASLDIGSNAENTPLLLIPLAARKDSVAMIFGEETLDLGTIYVNETTSSIINISNTGSTLNRGNISGASYFTIDAEEVELEAGENTSITLSYAGSSTPVEINEMLVIRDTICDRVSNLNVRLTVSSIPNYELELSMAKIEAFANDTISIPIKVTEEKDLTLLSETELKTNLTFNPTLLYPIDYTFTTKNEKEASITLDNIEISGKQSGDILATIDFIVALGNAEGCNLKLENYESIGGDVNITVIDGYFELLGICEEGGPRLISPDGVPAGIENITPNPATEEVNLTINFIETGKSEVAIYNYMGEKIKSIFEETITTPREEKIKVSVSDYSSGLYFIIFESPTVRETKEVMIMR